MDVSSMSCFHILPQFAWECNHENAKKAAGHGARLCACKAIRPHQRYLPVTLSGQAAISSGVPVATMAPPCTPPPGPMSIT